MSILACIGDIHLGASLSLGKSAIGTALNSRIVDQTTLLDWALDQAIDNNVEHIVLTGDIFEEPKPHPSLITLFLNWVKRCVNQNIKLHIINGNHDILRSGSFTTSSLDIISECEIDGCYVYKDLSSIMIGSTSITFMPFRDRKSFIVESNEEALNILSDMLQYELASIPLSYNKILIGHMALEGSIPIGNEIDDLINEIFCPIKMFKGYDYVWMGHIHKAQIMNKSPYIAHIGSMDISNFGECDQKKNIVLFDTDNLSFEEIEIPTRPLKKILIVVPKDTKDTTKYVAEEIEKNYSNLDKAIVKVEISLSSDSQSIDRGFIEKLLYKSGAFNISGLSESKKLSLVKKSDSTVIDTTMDVSSAIKMWSDEKYPDKKDELKKQKLLEVAISVLNKFKSEQ